MKSLFVFVCAILIGCDNKPVQPVTTYVSPPAPTPTIIPQPPVEIDRCAFAYLDSDKECVENNKDCIFTTNDNHCIISKKKPTRKELARLAAEEAVRDKERIAKLAAQQRLCSGKNIMNTCCQKACSGEQSIQNCLMSFYRKGCDAVEGMTITCGCVD